MAAQRTFGLFLSHPLGEIGMTKTLARWKVRGQLLRYLLRLSKNTSKSAFVEGGG